MKPTIWKTNWGSWACAVLACRGTIAPGAYTGTGRTPRAAYQNWLGEHQKAA